jgi:hypothetical protein
VAGPSVQGLTGGARLPAGIQHYPRFVGAGTQETRHRAA